jgi:hypothetical protein
LQGTAVALQHIDVRPLQAIAERGDQILVDLQSSDRAAALAQDVGGEARPGTDLEHVITEWSHPLDPGQQVGLESRCPFRAGQVRQMLRVHAVIVSPRTGTIEG